MSNLEMDNTKLIKAEIEEINDKLENLPLEYLMYVAGALAMAAAKHPPEKDSA